MYKLRIIYHEFSLLLEVAISLLLEVATSEAATLLIEDVFECLTYVTSIS